MKVSPFNQVAANINGDSSIDIDDVTSLISIVLGNTNLTQMAAWNAVPVKGGIHVENKGEQLLEIYDFDADCVATISQLGSHDVMLPAGIYMVTSDTASVKVVVK